MLFIIKGGGHSSREGAIRQQGREDAVHPPFVNEGWGTLSFEREDVILIEGGSHSSKEDTVHQQGREDAVLQEREGAVCQ